MAVHPSRVSPLCWSPGRRSWGEQLQTPAPQSWFPTSSGPAEHPQPCPCWGQHCSMQVSAGQAPLRDAASFAQAVPCQSPSAASGMERDVQFPGVAATVSCSGVRPGVTPKGCKPNKTSMHSVSPPSLQGSVGTHGCHHHCAQQTCCDLQWVLGAPSPWL